VYYAPDSHRDAIVRAGVVGRPRSAELTRIWQALTRPLAQLGVPAFALLAAAGGAVINLRSRRGPDRDERLGKDQPSGAVAELPRHTGGMRLLHWFNAVSWVLLLTTGTALMIAPAFALFGTPVPAAISRIFGGGANLLRAHVVWGLLWAVVIVPLFLVFKKGGIEALREIRPRRDDLVWLMRKPLVAMGMSREPLPPQDKYNAGQKVFAVTALVGTAVIILSGIILAFHLGPAPLVSAMILVHKLAIALALAGLAVHITMAALVRDERPALKSMLTGRVSREHAETHASRWVEELASETQDRGAEPRSEQDG
jgi:formate dehydrogenase gamma subunit